jgi:hypothetical protein
VVGGGCYGTFYAGQLEIARGKGALEVERVLVVDRDAIGCPGSHIPGPELVVSEWEASRSFWPHPPIRPSSVNLVAHVHLVSGAPRA